MNRLPSPHNHSLDVFKPGYQLVLLAVCPQKIIIAILYLPPCISHFSYSIRLIRCLVLQKLSQTVCSYLV